MDIGQCISLQISETATTRTVQIWLFPPRFSDKNRFTSSCPDAVLVAPIFAKTKNNKLLVMDGGGYFGAEGGKWGRRPGAPLQHRQPSADPPTPDSTNPKISAFFNVTYTSSRSNTVRMLDF
jgi:hypothetical protein